MSTGIVVEGVQLSPQQRHVWSLQQNNPQQNYVVRCLVKIEGELDRAMLHQAIQTSFGRHEILHTVFPRLPGMTFPIQSVLKDSLSIVRELNLEGLTKQEQAKETEKILDQLGRGPFEFANRPLAQIVLAALSRREFLLVLRLHALCGDRRSLQNLVAQIAGHYRECSDSVVGPQSDVMQYADFSEWQNQLLESSDAKARTEYWQRIEVCSPDEMALPFQKHVRSLSFEAEHCSYFLDRATVDRIHNLATDGAVSVSNFLLGCWQILLARLDVSTNPQEAKQILQSLRTPNQDPAVSRAADEISSQISK